MVQYFISYSRENKSIVERLQTDLQNAGVKLWIDKIGLTPGTPDWDEALREAIRECDAVLFMASPDSRRSAYVRDELALAKSANKPIYPVWVDGDDWMDAVPMGLGSTQNVDLRDENYATNLTSLIGALNGNVATSETQTVEPVLPDPPVEPVANPRNPYKGLRAFRADDTRDFFGRSVLIEDLLTTIENDSKKSRLLAVLGASGSGKSSVMMAGVLPKLRQNHLDWIFLDPIVPSANPIEKLTIALARQFENKSQKAIREDLLDRSTRGLHRLACELSDKPVVLYIDQFEEVFTLVEKEQERRQFIDLITSAVTDADGVLTVLLSMRADFYDRPAQYRELGSLIEKQHVLITPMTLADLYNVVQLPAQLPDVGMAFDDNLVTEMVFAVREEAAALPLLQFTLDQLFQRREGNTLTKAAYDDIGGVQGALAQHAEATFNQLPSDQHKTLARALFLRLIEAGQTEQDTTRRRATYSELTLPDQQQTRILQEVANTFVDARLLVTDQSGKSRTIEVSHEALIREWGRLGAWLHDAREDLRLQKSLSADVAEWQRRAKPDDMLYRGTVLSDAQAWAERNSANRDETMFINESQRAEEEREEQAQRAARNLRYAFVGLGAVILLASITVAIFVTRDNAELQAEIDFFNLEVGRFGTLQAADVVVPLITQTPAIFEPTLTAIAVLNAHDPELRENQMTDASGVDMVFVPAGCFFMGSERGETDEQPTHEVCFDQPFWIDRYEVTNEQYGSIGCEQSSSDPDQPRNCVSWFDAVSHCESRGAWLPTEAEWEYAARGPDSLVYPWGNTYNAENVIGTNDPEYGGRSTAPVGSRAEGASWVGAMDMSGNIWEWTSTIYEDYPYDEADGREDLADENSQRVLRGGSFVITASYLRSADRNRSRPTSEIIGFGFRCARSYE
ncbi:MAG: SUMF1/EgtB/PvdO family nonheme iron enzyme [Anaerolineae bacterium]